MQVDQSELAFRLLCRRHGATAAYTPMLHSRLFLEHPEYREEHFTTCPEDRSASLRFLACLGLSHASATICQLRSLHYTCEGCPLFLADDFDAYRPLLAQFCANDPGTLLAAAQMVQDRCDAIDLNLGCPQRIAKRGRYGAFLMDDQPLVARLISHLAANLKVPVTAKVGLPPAQRPAFLAIAADKPACRTRGSRSALERRAQHALACRSVCMMTSPGPWPTRSWWRPLERR